MMMLLKTPVLDALRRTFFLLDIINVILKNCSCKLNELNYHNYIGYGK